MLGYHLRRAIENLIHSLFSRWQDWTPTLTQSGAVTFTIATARYLKVGKSCTVTCQLNVTGAGTGNNAITVGALPFSMANTSGYRSLGSAAILDSGTAIYGCSVVPASSTSVQFCGYNVANLLGIAPNYALANNDVIGFTIEYETT